MDKEYRIKTLGSGAKIGIFLCIFFPIFIAYVMLASGYFNWYIFFGVLLYCSFFIFIPIYYSRSKIIITNDSIILKSPDKTTKTPWNEIKKVTKTWTIFAGGFNYIVHTKKQGTFGIPDTFENYEEILETIKEKTGLKIQLGL